MTFKELGQLDLIKATLSSIVVPVGTKSLIESACIGFILGL